MSQFVRRTWSLTQVTRGAELIVSASQNATRGYDFGCRPTCPKSVPDPSVPHDSVRVTCYLDASQPGGSSNSLALLINSLGPRFEVSVVGSSADMLTEVSSRRVDVLTRLVPPVKNKFDFRAMRQHMRAIRELRPDILHVNLDNPWTAQYGLLIGVLTRTPVVAVVHMLAPPWRRRQQWLVQVMARGVDVYVAVSGYTARNVERLLHRPKGSVRIIHNGVLEPSQLAAQRLGPGIQLGAVGRLSPEKGFEYLIESMTDLSPCHLTVVGDGPERPRLEGLIRKHGLEDRVTLAGWVEPPWTSRLTFDILVAPSLEDSFPLVLLEAMMAGIPVVASDVGGIPEIVEPGRTGLLVPPRNPVALADAIERLQQDEPLRLGMARQSSEAARSRFSVAMMATRFEDLYDEIVTRRPPRGR
jgi:glycosyltransferase involved in cell wall biosynthesis